MAPFLYLKSHSFNTLCLLALFFLSQSLCAQTNAEKLRIANSYDQAKLKELQTKFSEKSEKNYLEAKKWAEKYVNDIEPNNTQAMWLIKSCQESVIQDLHASGKLYKVSPVDELNTENDEFAPTYFKNDLVFISARDHPSHIKNFKHGDYKVNPLMILSRAAVNSVIINVGYSFSNFFVETVLFNGPSL